MSSKEREIKTAKLKKNNNNAENKCKMLTDSEDETKDSKKSHLTLPNAPEYKTRRIAHQSSKLPKNENNKWKVIGVAVKVLNKEIRQRKSIDNIKSFKEEVKDTMIDAINAEMQCFRDGSTSSNDYSSSIINKT